MNLEKNPSSHYGLAFQQALGMFLSAAFRPGLATLLLVTLRGNGHGQVLPGLQKGLPATQHVGWLIE